MVVRPALKRHIGGGPPGLDVARILVTSIASGQVISRVASCPPGAQEAYRWSADERTDRACKAVIA
jgi:hypothetical protein